MTKGKGEDEEVEDEEELEKEEPLKKKGKVIITKLAKPSTVVFTRKSSSKKVDKEGGDIIFRKPPPTFQDRLIELEAGDGIIDMELKFFSHIISHKIYSSIRWNNV